MEAATTHPYLRRGLIRRWILEVANLVSFFFILCSAVERPLSLSLWEGQQVRVVLILGSLLLQLELILRLDQGRALVGTYGWPTLVVPFALYVRLKS